MSTAVTMKYVLTITRSALFLVVGVLVLGASPAVAQVEVEADPIAYALSGFSLHAGTALGRTRLSVGAFGADIPKFIHGKDDWTSSVRGATVKWDYVGSSLDGFFVGLDGTYGRARYRYTPQPEDGRVTRDLIGLGLRGGYKFSVGQSGLYVVPWMSVSLGSGGDDVVVGGETFDRGSVTIFPTVHVGWRF